jgi:hypothetical protein
MDASRPHAWIRAALLLGLVYFLIGRLFALPTTNVRVWRLAAWIVSAGAYAVHIGYEHSGLRNPPRLAAWHVAVAVAIGALALAAAAMIRSWSITSAIRPVWLLALVAWPAVTGIPAFLVAWVAAAALQRFSRSAGIG